MKRLPAGLILLSFLCLAGCAGMPPVYVQLGGGGGVDNELTRPRPRPEPRIVTTDILAAEAARDALSSQGSAADGAVALGFTLAVTLPSSAGLGGGGVCVLRDQDGKTEGLDFRNARLASGLYALHAKAGRRPWSSLVVSAETLARFGHPVSSALAKDLSDFGAVLARDARAIAEFMTPDRRLIVAGDEWRQPALADTLARVRRQPILGSGSPVWFTPTATKPSSALAPGATGFMVRDAAGMSVGCILSMGAPFGLGAVAYESGYLFGANLSDDEILSQQALDLLTCIDDASGADKPEGSNCLASRSTFSLIP